MEEKKQGGKRVGAGRKPIGIKKKVTITLFVEGGNILKFGSKDKLKEKVYGFIEDYGKEAVVIPLPEGVVPYRPIEPEKPNYEAKLPPKPESLDLGDFNGFQDDILSTRDGNELEAIMRKVKSSLMALGLKKKLEAIASEHGADFFTD